MSAPPEANTEYSRGSGPSERLLVRRCEGRYASSSAPRAGRNAAGTSATARSARGRARRAPDPRRAVHRALPRALGDELGADQDRRHRSQPRLGADPDRAARGRARIRGLPHRSRAALVALALLGVVTLLIALLGDLPDAHATGVSGRAPSSTPRAASTAERRPVHGDARRGAAAAQRRASGCCLLELRSASETGDRRAQAGKKPLTVGTPGGADGRHPDTAGRVGQPPGIRRYSSKPRGLSHCSPRSRVVGSPRV